MVSHADDLVDILASAADGSAVEKLFDAATIGVLVVNEGTGIVIAGNPAAQRLLGLTRSKLVGQPWQEVFDRHGVQSLGAAAREAAASGVPVHTSASAVGGGPGIAATLSTFCVSKQTYLLCRLVPENIVQSHLRLIANDVLAQLEAINLCFVVTDGALCIESGNKAFLEVVHQPATEQIAGQSLLRWDSLRPSDLSRMRRQMLSREAGAVLTAMLCDGPESGAIVEIMAIAVPDDITPQWGFVLHKLVSH